MARTKLRKNFIVVAAASALAMTDIAAAFAIPATPFADAGGAQPTLARAGGFHGGGHHGGGHWGGRPGGHAGGGHWGGRPGGGHGGHWGGHAGGHAGGHWGGHGGHWAGRPGYHGGAWGRPGGYYGGWNRPYYGWNPGGAIAAGAAIGFLTAATATAYAASRPPAPGLCWYYTDPSRRAGFWDYCP